MYVSPERRSGYDVLVQPNVDEDGNLQPMVIDSKGRIIVDSYGYIWSSKACPQGQNCVGQKTQTAGIQEAMYYVYNTYGGGKVFIRSGQYYINTNVMQMPPNVEVEGESEYTTEIIQQYNGVSYTFALSKNNKIKHLTLNANSIAQNSLIFGNGAKDFEIAYNRFINQGATWYIQLGCGGLSSSSPPSVFNERGEIHHNYFQNVSSGLENIIICATKHLDFHDNYLGYTGGPMNSPVLTVYSYNEDIKLRRNYQYTNAPINLWYIFDSKDVVIEDNTFEFYEPSISGYGNFVLELGFAVKNVHIRRNKVFNSAGPALSVNANSFGYFIQLSWACANSGAGNGPDRNYQWLSGCVDYVYVEDNHVDGGYGVMQIQNTSNYSATLWAIERNVMTWLRFFANWGINAQTVLFRGNREITYQKYGQIGGNGSPWLALSGTNIIFTDNVITGNQPFFGSSSGPFNNVVLTANNALIAENNLLGGSGYPSAGMPNWWYLNAKYASVRNNKDFFTGMRLFPYLVPPSGQYFNTAWANTPFISFSTLTNTSATAPASGTTYQNVTPFDTDVIVVVNMQPTSSAAATASASIGPSSSSLTQIEQIQAPAGSTSGQYMILRFRVPAQWYFQVNLSNASIILTTVIVHSD